MEVLKIKEMVVRLKLNAKIIWQFRNFIFSLLITIL